MSYPGNPSLSAEVQRRILGTFNQSLDLAAAGRRQEASLGCEFILQLDSSFEAARVLRERLSQSEAAIAVEDLRGGQLPPPAPAPPPITFATQQMTIPPLGPTLAAELRDLLDRRDFGSILSRLQATPALLQQPGVREIAAAAQSRFEAEPYVQSYLEAAGRALQSGAIHEIPGILDKARALDPSHPLIAELARAATAAGESSSGFHDRELPEVDSGASLDPVEDYELEIPEDEWNLEAADLGPLDPGLGGLPAGDFSPLTPPAASSPSPLPSFSAPSPGPSFDLGPLDALPALDTAPRLADPAPWSPPTAPAPAPPPSFSSPSPAPPPPLSELPSFSSVPAAPALAPEPTSFAALDLGRSGGSSSGDERIAALLEEGQNAQARGDHQGAIDAWSRIFLIDVDHAEAAQRIEGARRLKTEQERQVEEIFHEGVTELERGRPEEARTRFNRVLSLQPGHLAAREALDRLEAGTGSFDLGLGDPATSSGFDPLASFGATAADLREEILVPPPPGGTSATSAGGDGRKAASLENFRMVAVKKETPKRTFALVGGAVFVLVLAAGWLVASNWKKIFPNSTEEAPVTTAAPVDPIVHAEKLFKEGKTENALAYLKRVRPDHPKFATAQSMISSWEKAAEEQAAAAEGAVLDQQRDRLISAAEAAEKERELLLASLLYERAAKSGPLDATEQAAADRINQVLKPIREEIVLYREREYDLVLPRLWRKHEADRGNRDVLRMLVDIYFNLGVKSLQQNDPRKALTQFDQVLELTANDAESQRLRRFAQVYSSRSQDLLYRTFVKYLPQR